MFLLSSRVHSFLILGLSVLLSKHRGVDTAGAKKVTKTLLVLPVCPHRPSPESPEEPPGEGPGSPHEPPAAPAPAVAPAALQLRGGQGG